MITFELKNKLDLFIKEIKSNSNVKQLNIEICNLNSDTVITGDTDEDIFFFVQNNSKVISITEVKESFVVYTLMDIVVNKTYSENDKAWFFCDYYCYNESYSHNKKVNCTQLELSNFLDVMLNYVESLCLYELAFILRV